MKLEEPKCPLNYFGKGKNYDLPQDQVSQKWFTDEWNKWEEANPEDLDGSKALAEYERRINLTPAVAEVVKEVKLGLPPDVQEPDPAISLPPVGVLSPDGVKVLQFKPGSPTHQGRLTIQEDIWNAFEFWCRLQRITMSSQVERFMLNTINQIKQTK